MRYILASKLILLPNTTEVSRPLPVVGFNTAQIDVVMFHAQSLTVKLEQSNDGENWRALNEWACGSDMAYSLLSETRDVASALVRVRWTAAENNSGPMMVASGINLTNT